jgi:molybdopterin/thiamine biosynthesis adenylyltransferase
MTPTTGSLTLAALFQRSLSAHLPEPAFTRLQQMSVLIAGLGGGSNIAELLARKGVGRMTIADLDVYEPHNIRQRGSTSATWGKDKVDVMADRLREINPFAAVTPVRGGVTLANARELVEQADVAVDMLDFHALKEKVALHRAAREQGKMVLTAPSVVNGAVLYVFTPAGPSFEEFFEYQEGLPLGEQALRFLKRLIVHFPPEAPEELYRAAARGERTIPLDAVGVDQAAVLTAAAIENLALGRTERVVAIPRGIQIDASDPGHLSRIVDFTSDFEARP